MDTTSPVRDALSREPIVEDTPGRRLFQLIRLKGMRRTWVAEQLQITPNYLSKLMNGERRITPELAVRIADVLGVPVNEVTGG